MKTGDFVEVDYVGSIKNTGDIFDLTKEDIAKEKNIYNPKVRYRPVVLVLGAGFIIKGLDEALQEMKVGEKKKIEIPPEKAFGERRDELVKLIPLAKFKDQNLEPFPGATVSVGDLRGKVASVDGGRVKVDFNHPLAGKTLEYELEVKSLVEKKDEKVKSIVNYFTGIDDAAIVCKDEEAEININKGNKDLDIPRPVKYMISENIIKWCGVTKVKFVETFEKSSEENKQESKDKNNTSQSEK